ncbi:keratin-associated protein 19-2-like [Daphnia carinata]|uniref:keratin-associated protein 19-2-like n=1 Tax=Daphnia carinata TaxID=120202 RepID=UPI00257D8808|nr:keratin-associated protein 19-2-like [Daphnia carinata]
MKVVIVLACLMALAAAVETDAVVEASDLDVAESRRVWHHGGYPSGYRPYGSAYRGTYGWGRQRRSVEDGALASDLEAAEHQRRSYGGYGSTGGWGGYGSTGGYGSYGSTGGYGSYGSTKSNGYGNTKSYGYGDYRSGYGGWGYGSNGGHRVFGYSG